MVDRIIDLPIEARTIIEEKGFGWFTEGDNDDYVANDAILIHKDEIKAYSKAAEECYRLYAEALEYVQRNDYWSRLGLSPAIIPLIKHDLKRGIPHICGRMDLAGGIDELPLKLIEFNADTGALMPESAYFQSWFHESVRLQFKGQFNYLIQDLTKGFRNLKQKFSNRPATLLLTSLGYPEDRLNLKVIEEAAEAAGFAVDYSDLENVIFDEDGVFLESEGEEENYVQYHFVYKLVPWEFIMLEEPELMDILVDLCTNHDLIVLNPSYTLAYQAKHMMSILYELFPDNPYLLPTYDHASNLRGQKHVQKVNFGRLGENVAVVEGTGDILAETDGDFGHFSKVYQEFAEMYQDEDGDIYQAGLYVCEGKASCLSFRRRDDWIIDDDSEFVSHVLFG